MRRSILLTGAVLLAACGGGAPRAASPGMGTSSGPSFADDLAFLTAHGPVHVLESPEGAKVAISAKYQGRVMTSAVESSGRSFGWINRDFITSGKAGTPFDNYGGEDRFWLGPEGGQNGLYFAPGAPFAFDAWQVPHELQEGAWEMREATRSRAVLARAMHVTSWSGVSFDVGVVRTVALLSKDEARAALGVDTSSGGVKSVAFATTNTIANQGKEPWTRDKGLVSIWVLAMYAPAADGWVVVPFEKGGAAAVNDAYFGKVASDRLVVHDDRGVLFFKSDGKVRGKIGLGPTVAKPVLGSYSAEAGLLTIVQYDKPSGPRPYVDSMWRMQKDPYAGDVVNSYNDGPPAPGKPALGGFYELETSSPGAELPPGGTLVHTHRTFHFTGAPEALEPIAKAVLGVSLSSIGK